jgi:multidrug resistance efflux pump
LFGYLGYRVYLSRQPYEWSGTVEARTISVGSRTGGRVKEVLVREGDRVATGQPLIFLEAGDLPAQKLAAEGQLLQAKANLEKLERGTRREQIAAAEARLAAAQVAVDKAQLEANRIHKLFDRGAASRADVDNVDAQLRSAIAQRNVLKQALDELRNGVRVEDIVAARGQVDTAQGRLDQILVMIDELTVHAPRPARVETLDLRPGDIVAPNGTTAKLVEDDQLYVRIYVPETLIGRLRVGQEVPITVDSFPEKSFKGVVEHIHSVGEYSPRNLQTSDERADQVFGTRIGVRSGLEDLRAGMAAFIRVPK